MLKYLSVLLERRYEKRGLASIPTVIVLMILIISIGVLITSISFSDNASVSGLNESNKALNFAQSGAKDALEKIARNKDYSGTYSLEMVTGGCSGSYLGCANVTVDAANPKTISVEGRSLDIKRKIQVTVNLDVNGLITSYNWQEL